TVSDRVSARHHARAVSRAVLAAGNTHTEKVKSELTQHFCSSRRVDTMGIASVDKQVSFVKQRRNLVDHVVYRLTRRHEHHDGSRPVQATDEFREMVKPANALVVVELPFELGYFLRVSIESTNAKAMITHVEQQVSPHGAQSDHAKNVFFLHSGLIISRSERPRYFSRRATLSSRRL